MPILIILLLFGSIAGGGFFYYKDTQATIATLRDNNAKLEMEEDAEQAKARMEELNVRAREAEQYQDELISKLRRHNLTALALQKPGMIEKRVNNAVEKLARELEEYTSDKPVESDITDTVSE